MLVIRRRRAGGSEAVSLGDAVRAVAECPCAPHQKSLGDALAATDELVLRVMDASVPPGEEDDQVVENRDEIQVATAVAPNGRSFVQVFTDLEAAQSKYPEGSFVSVPAQAAFRMSLSNGNEGLLVTAAGDDDPWAAVTADGVVRLITSR